MDLNAVRIKDLQQIMILNFNYTTTIDRYIDQKLEFGKELGITVNYIHGKLNDENNPLIFGYGDDDDVDYSAVVYVYITVELCTRIPVEKCTS